MLSPEKASMRIEAGLLDAINEAAVQTYPNEFVAALRAEKGVINELLMLPGTISGETSGTLMLRSGDTVIVCDRTTPIARLAPLDSGEDHISIRESARPIGELKKVRPVRLRRKVNLDRVLREMRGAS